MSRRPRKRWPSVDAAGLEPERGHRHDVGAVQRQQPVRGPDELAPSCRRRAGSSSPSGSAASRACRRAPPAGRPRAACPSRSSTGTAPRPCRRTRASGGRGRRRPRATGRRGARGRARRGASCSAAVGRPSASSATVAGISFCVNGWSGDTGSTWVIFTASRRGVAYGVATLAVCRKPRSRSPSASPAANASPSSFSAFGGSSSVKSSTVSAARSGSAPFRRSRTEVGTTSGGAHAAAFAAAAPSIGKPSASRES